MVNKDYTHIATIVDRSGSMGNIAADMRGGLDSYFEDQAKQPGKCLVDYAMFDTQYELAFENREVSEAKAVLEPRGGTALLDAIGKTVVNLGEKFAAMAEDDRPGAVIVVVVTDGYENSSHEWRPDAIKDLITRQREEWNWEFVFLGANQDAITVGQSYGFAGGSSMTYTASPTGVTNTGLSLSAHSTQYRSTGAASFTDEDRKNAQES